MKDYNNFYKKYDNDKFPFIRIKGEAIHNVIEFINQVITSPELRGRLSCVKKWYYNFELNLFTPSKFIGYKDNFTELYIKNSTKNLGSNRMNGRNRSYIRTVF